MRAQAATGEADPEVKGRHARKKHEGQHKQGRQTALTPHTPPAHSKEQCKNWGSISISFDFSTKIEPVEDGDVAVVWEVDPPSLQARIGARGHEEQAS